MKVIAVILLLVFFFAPAISQQTQIPVFKSRLSISANDSDKIHDLTELSWFYAFSFPDSALKFSLEGLKLAEQTGSQENQVNLLTAVAQAFSGLGNSPEALKAAFKALELSEKLHRDTLIAWSLANIGAMYFDIEDYPNALKYFIKIKTYPDAYNKEKLLHTGLIGETYYQLNQFDSALLYIQQCYDLDVKSEEHWGVPYLYMGKLYENKKMFAEALALYQGGFEKKISKSDSLKNYLAIANVFKQKQLIDSGIYYGKLVFSIAQNTSLYRFGVDASSLLTDLYKVKKQTDSAFKYQEITLAGKDSLFSREKTNQLQSLTYNEQQRQQEIITEKEKFRNQLKVYGLISGLIAFSLIVLILLRSNRFKQKAYIILEKQKKKIDAQKLNVENTLSELKSTQSQLIQSEKMASLGQLTAGIAHEIQNPLNFVNNFSDINKELLAELKEEADKGNISEVKTIANDIIDNEEKINHHGKRADAIVKGMLQHSRTSTGIKELADINALADEYLRLAYHGMRGKDKSFNAAMQTDFDSSIGKINIIPQDIGRVLLNLYNNSFYAVNEKKKSAVDEYEPTVSISTKMVGDKIEMRVKDNGNGIPQNITDKIFQPFFTTKPTGQGTGLGLSLSYDIVKAHGGEITAKTEEGKGSEFIINLPV